MILITIIARVSDGLPLAASGQEDEQSGTDLQLFHNKAKQLLRKMNAQSPERCTLEAGDVNFHLFIAQGVCYLSLCDVSYPKKMAFAYLENLHNKFYEEYGRRIPTVTRPYSFIEFDTHIQKTKRSYADFRARRNLSIINSELQDAQKIMVANIEEILQRGKSLSDLNTMANHLSTQSRKYRSDAESLNNRSIFARAAVVGVIFITVIVYVRFWWL